MNVEDLDGSTVTASTHELITDVDGQALAVERTEHDGLLIVAEPYRSPSPVLGKRCLQSVHDSALSHETSGRDGSTVRQLSWSDPDDDED